MSREIQINGYTYKIKALLRKQVRQLRVEGYNLAALSRDKADEAMDKVFNLEFSKEELASIDELPHADALKLWGAILKETYGDREEEKNS